MSIVFIVGVVMRQPRRYRGTEVLRENMKLSEYSLDFICLSNIFK